MIRFVRTGRYSLYLEFDVVGASALVSTFQLALKSHEALVEVESDSTFKRNVHINKLRVICNEPDNKISYSLSTLILELDSDYLEYGIERLNDCLLGNDFFPAEFYDLIEKSKQEVTLYGKFCK